MHDTLEVPLVLLLARQYNQGMCSALQHCAVPKKSDYIKLCLKPSRSWQPLVSVANSIHAVKDIITNLHRALKRLLMHKIAEHYR